MPSLKRLEKVQDPSRTSDVTARESGEVEGGE